VKLKWINKLIADLKKNPKKGVSALRPNEGGHCCLGRLARLMGGHFRQDGRDGSGDYTLYFKGKDTRESGLLPLEMMNLVDLSHEDMSWLTRTNDESDDWVPVIDVLQEMKAAQKK